MLVNNAGGAFGSDPVATADPEEWRAMYDVNVLGTLHVTQALLPALRASGDAVIVNVGSTAGRVAYEGGGGYTAAKHGTQVMTETLRLELVGEPIRISEIAPGMVRTDEFALVRFEGDQEQGRRGVRRRPRPAGRRGRRRRDRLDRHPAQPRQHRRAGDPAPRAGRPAQGAPRHLMDPGWQSRPTGQTSGVQTIGLVGGMSWESSAAYYKDLNLGVEQRLGGLHSIRTVMASVEFAEVTALGRQGRWDEVAAILVEASLRHGARRRRLPDALHHDVPPGRRPGRGGARHPAAAPRRRRRRGLQGPAAAVGGLPRHHGSR